MGASSSKDAPPDWSSTSPSELEWQQMPDSGSAKGMLEIMPADDLVFPFETFKDAVCCMTLKNTTAYYDVAYWIQTTRPERYRIQNNISVISPWSSATVNVIMVAQNEAPPDMECKDKFLVRSAALKDDTTIKGLNRNMFEIDPAYVVDCVKLGVVLKPRPQETDVMVFRPPTRDGVDIQLQDELQKWRNVLQNVPGYTLLETDCQQIKRCIQIGLICVNPERAKRPTMKKLIDMLEGLESMNWYISSNELSSHGINGGALV